MNSFVDGFMGSLGTAAAWGLIALLCGIVAFFARRIIMRFMFRRYIKAPIRKVGDTVVGAGTVAYDTASKVGATAYDVAGKVGADAASKLGAAGAKAYDTIRTAGTTTYDAATKAGSVAYDATTAVAAATRKVGDGLVAKSKGE
jgi:hypothetical protein